MRSEVNYSNHLLGEKSPYLLQHANNPVDWYPWGEEAFEKAKREDKPIFLSIGYSTCHWCHVMENESFEDEEVADLINNHFVPVKVDREERPDIDSIYMTVCQMMTGSGGWPLTIFMTHDQKPFFAATYIPKENRMGSIGMLQLIPRIGEIWKTRREKILESTNSIIQALEKVYSPSSTFVIDKSILVNTYNGLKANFDNINGGIGTAPKFPTPHNLLFLLRYWNDSAEMGALEMVKLTLKKMRLGGIFDHVGFGFHRYSTDSQWLVPHFEKMLYDQALISRAYLETYHAFGDEFFASTAREIFSYVLRDMTSRDGAFYSAEDADSEGREGKFYLWSAEEIRNTLNKGDAELAIKIFNIRDEGNFLEESTQKATGENILHLTDELSNISDELGIPFKELSNRLEKIIEILFQEREKRIHPHKDDKILTDWNGLMIASLAYGARVLNDSKYLEAAENAVDFILNRMMTPDNRLFHRYRDGEASIPGNLDDYAFLSWSLVELYETCFNEKYLKLAIGLSEQIIEHFSDIKGGGFYLSPDDGEQLISRVIDFYDGAIPSGNSIAFLNFTLLGNMTGNSKWLEHADMISKRAAGSLKQNPTGHSMLAVGLVYVLGKSYEIVISGDPDNDSTIRMIDEINRPYIPNKVVIINESNNDESFIQEIAPYTREQIAINDKATAYVCNNHACDRPTNDINEAIKLISGDG